MQDTEGKPIKLNCKPGEFKAEDFAATDFATAEDKAKWANKHSDALVMATHFPNLQDMAFVINIFQENDPEFNSYPFMKEWLRFFRSIVQEVAELWTIRIIVNESIAEKIGCLNDGDVVITDEQTPPY